MHLPSDYEIVDDFEMIESHQEHSMYRQMVLAWCMPRLQADDMSLIIKYAMDYDPAIANKYKLEFSSKIENAFRDHRIDENLNALDIELLNGYLLADNESSERAHARQLYVVVTCLCSILRPDANVPLEFLDSILENCHKWIADVDSVQVLWIMCGVLSTLQQEAVRRDSNRDLHEAVAAIHYIIAVAAIRSLSQVLAELKTGDDFNKRLPLIGSHLLNCWRESISESLEQCLRLMDK